MESLPRPVAEARSVSELVAQAKHGKLRIPPFQRRFRWQAEDIEQLFDSIRRGYPIGSLLIWERAADAGHVEFGPLQIEAPAMEDAWWVVDGQQRLTSIVGVLASPPDCSAEFDLYYDLSTAEFKRPGPRRRPSSDWIPLRRVVDTNEFVSWLIEFRENGASSDQVQAATELGNQLRDYRVPVSLVRAATESELRIIFDRMNTYGKRLTKAEVFQSLHAATNGSEPADLRSLVEDVGNLGFGSPQEDTVLRALLAIRSNGDPYRDFRGEFAKGEDPAAAFATALDALRRVVAFLQYDAGIPHVRVLPYAYVIPVLARLLTLHHDPTQRNRILLRRWLWRGAVAGGSGGSGAAPVLRRAVQAIDEDESATVQRLLRLAPALPTPSLDLRSHQLNRAAGRLNIALLNRLQPLNLRDGKPVDVAALLDEGELLRIPSRSGRFDSIASVFLHPALRDDEIADTFAAASADILASHGVNGPLERDAGLDLGQLVTLRERSLSTLLPARLDTLTEPQANDRPAIAELLALAKAQP
ncbi:MAG TPA: DUF262 domain-containing protein [Solirubrobacteraceae bacterium]|nr:DUF262 domain-containing protein [Solirubrobacteraceae bacterium]